MNFAEQLKIMRKQYGISQEQLAEKIGVSRQAITKWETGGGMPDIENILAIAALFHVSMDELLSAEKTAHSTPGFFYESATEYDIDGAKHYDIHAGGAAQITLEGMAGEKFSVRLASNIISNLPSSFKVKIDEHKNRLDVEVQRVGQLSEAQAKEALHIFIGVPAKFLAGLELSAICGTLRLSNIEAPELEFDGKANTVYINSVNGRVELDCANDMNIFCREWQGRIGINQISATSTIHIPSGTAYIAKKKGKSNRIDYTLDGKPSGETAPDGNAENIIELAGMNAELVINEYTQPPKEA